MPDQIQSAPRPDFVALTHQIPATLHLDGPDSFEVVLFLANLSSTHAGPESLDEHLNRPRECIPVRSQVGETDFLVRREAIQRVEVRPDAPTLFTMIQGMPQCDDFIRIQLSDGVNLEGTLRNILPSAAPRLSDVINDPRTGFVVLESRDGVTYVNKSFINIVWLSKGK